MKEQKTICPVIETDMTSVLFEKIEPVLQFLESNDALPETSLVFPIGTVTNDGRLDLCKQNLGADGARMIVGALKQNQSVKHLLLGTNKIGNQGAIDLSEAIAHNSSLETLYLGCNYIESEGAIALCEALEHNTDIKSVWFKRNPIGKDSVPALINLLKKNSHIRTLDLVNTCLEDGFCDLFDYFKENQSVERLYLSGNYLIPPQYMAHLAGVLTHNKTLKALFVSVNNFGDEGATLLAKGLAQNTTLEELSVASCGLQEAGIICLLDALAQNKNLKHLDLGYASSTRVLQSKGNTLSDVAAQKLLEFIEASPQLMSINLIKTNLSDTYKGLFSKITDRRISIDGLNNKKTIARHPDSQAIKSVYR
jgi:Ran GTPase-activating protein (RanGAP) involved in mRNA processing and transport